MPSWKEHRKVLQSLFKYRSLTEYVSVFQKHCEQALVELDELNGEDRNNNFANVFYRIIFKIGLGKCVLTSLLSYSRS